MSEATPPAAAALGRRSRYALAERGGARVVVDVTGATVPRDVEDLAASLTRARRQEQTAISRQRVIVQQMRLAGASWAVIGQCLGVTREAAFKRYSGDQLI